MVMVGNTNLIIERHDRARSKKEECGRNTVKYLSGPARGPLKALLNSFTGVEYSIERQRRRPYSMFTAISWSDLSTSRVPRHQIQW